MARFDFPNFSLAPLSKHYMYFTRAYTDSWYYHIIFILWQPADAVGMSSVIIIFSSWSHTTMT